MNKIIPLILLFAGLTITIIGIRSTQHTSSDPARTFTGVATDKAVLTLMLGSIVAAIGLALLIRACRRA